jgi:hypothetical protein
MDHDLDLSAGSHIITVTRDVSRYAYDLGLRLLADHSAPRPTWPGRPGLERQRCVRGATVRPAPPAFTTEDYAMSSKLTRRTAVAALASTAIAAILPPQALAEPDSIYAAIGRYEAAAAAYTAAMKPRWADSFVHGLTGELRRAAREAFIDLALMEPRTPQGRAVLEAYFTTRGGLNILPFIKRGLAAGDPLRALNRGSEG